MKSTEYSDKVLDHFKNPRNVGEIEEADGIGQVGNPVCGDLMWIYLKVGKNDAGEEIIDDIKFKTFGCGSAVSTSSMITEMAKGMTLDEAYKISRIANWDKLVEYYYEAYRIALEKSKPRRDEPRELDSS